MRYRQITLANTRNPTLTQLEHFLNDYEKHRSIMKRLGLIKDSLISAEWTDF